MRASLKTACLLLAVIELSGCAAVPVAAPPQVVTVTKLQYQPLPKADLIPCWYPQNKIVTVQDLLLAEQGAIQSLMVCNKQLDDLRAISGKQKP